MIHIYKNNINGNLLISLIFVISGLLLFASLLLKKSQQVLITQQQSELELQAQFFIKSIHYKTIKDYKSTMPQSSLHRKETLCTNYNNEEKSVFLFGETDCNVLDETTFIIGKVESHATRMKPFIKKYLDRFQTFTYTPSNTKLSEPFFYENNIQKSYTLPSNIQISWWNDLYEQNNNIEISIQSPCIEKELDIEIIKTCTEILDFTSQPAQYFEGKNTYSLYNIEKSIITIQAKNEPLSIQIHNPQGDTQEYFLEDNSISVTSTIEIQDENQRFPDIEFQEVSKHNL
jgi:hypothetical protein